ncbi:MAG: hypothetical protein OEU76_10005, partial [Cyclobacteriaceae bacterium]|nr:hypothetical protein [Cyclobacteriaceae bacterium]
MKKINFQEHVFPHLIAIVVFLLVTLIFFRPLFFENKVLNQGDITQFLWGSKELRDYREATGEEGLWSTSMFSGMPAYMINVEWSNGVVKKLKSVLSLYLPHPVNNIFLAFLCYYILLIVFRIRWEFSIAGALAFGLCSYMIIGLAAGHNARIGAIAFMPLVMSGIHLVFTNKRWLGLGVTAAALALHLRENHLQITYYLILIVGIYGLAQLWQSYKEKKLQSFATSLAVLIPAALIAAGTFFGPMWAAAELGKYSTRGPSELKIPGGDGEAGLAKDYAFQYSNGILEPATFLVPNFFGGSSSNYLVNDPESATFKALQQVNDQNSFNQLAQFTSSYWGSQPLSAPYYIGAIVCFLFVLGVLLIEGPYKWWLITISLIGIVLSWGSNFPTLNYFLFDYLPGLNKFRSVTFSMIMVFFAFPMLGLMGLEKAVNGSEDRHLKRNLLIAFGVTGGLCFLLWIFPGIMGFVKDFERELPAWLLNALKEDRKALLRSDVLRSFFFIALAFAMLYFNILKWISTKVLALTLFLLVFIDLGLVDSRYFTQENYRRKRDNSSFEPNKADLEIKKDKGIFRVFNLAGFYEA